MGREYITYALILIGAILSFLSYKWSLHYMCNPNYYRLKGRSEVTQLWWETAFNVVFFGGYGLIIFAGGLRFSQIGVGFVIVLVLHVVVFPALGVRLKKPVENDANQTDEGN